MSNAVVVHKGRTCTLYVNMGIDVSGDTLTSQVRTEARVDAPFVMTWTINYRDGGDGSDGRLVFTVDNTITEQIAVSSGFMDIKRIVAGEPVPVFDQPLEVIFREAVTE